jgi:hypothetical protein
MIIDPGAQGRSILSNVRELGLDIIYIVLTHGHIDHIGALKEVKEGTGAEVAIHAGDARFLRRLSFSTIYNRSFPPGCLMMEIVWTWATCTLSCFIPRVIAQGASAFWDTGFCFQETPCSEVVLVGRTSLLPTTAN